MQLQRARATINELNTVRISISQLKGRKLVKFGENAHKVISIVIFDLINNSLELIATF